MRVDERTKKQYIIDELATSGWNDKIFLTEEDLCTRWNLRQPRYIRQLIHGRNSRGVKLRCFRLGHKTRRYKPTDVLEFEFEVWAGAVKELV